LLPRLYLDHHSSPLEEALSQVRSPIAAPEFETGKTVALEVEPFKVPTRCLAGIFRSFHLALFEQRTPSV
jgi:hypothetical protein